MFVQLRKNDKYQYVYIVESFRKPDGKIGHRTLEKVGRYDQLIEKDPDFLAKLKEKIKKRGHLARAEQQLFTKIDENASDIEKDINGFHIYSYANVVLRIIWREYLKLDYRCNYIQDYHYKDIGFNIGDHFFHRIVETILCNVINTHSDKVHLIGETFSAKEEMKHHAKFLEILSLQKDKLTEFISSKTAEYAYIPWLKDLSKILENEGALKTLTESSFMQSDAGKALEKGIENNESRMYFDLLKMLLIKAIYTIIADKLKNIGVKATLDEINQGLEAAMLLPYTARATKDETLYLKITGPRIDLMNDILRAFDMEPLLNSQLTKELCNRLKLKPKTIENNSLR